MRRSSTGKGLQSGGDDQRLEHRGGVLQSTEQRPGTDSETIEAFKFIVIFARELIRNNPSPDVLQLSMMAAAKQANLTKDQAEEFIAWVMELQKDSPFPEGFF